MGEDEAVLAAIASLGRARQHREAIGEEQDNGLQAVRRQVCFGRQMQLTILADGLGERRGVGGKGEKEKKMKMMHADTAISYRAAPVGNGRLPQCQLGQLDIIDMAWCLDCLSQASGDDLEQGECA